MLLALEPVNLNHSSSNTTNQTPLLEINILAIKVAFIQVIILLMYITFHQVPGAELGEGGSVVDLSHIAPSVLALIQVQSFPLPQTYRSCHQKSPNRLLIMPLSYSLSSPSLARWSTHPSQGGDNALATAAKYLASSPPALQV